MRGKIHTVSRSALVPESAQRMYELVKDVAEYPEFLPWCSGSEVLDETASEQLARVDVDLKVRQLSFVTRNRLDPGRSLRLELVEGPFHHLDGVWQFEPLDDAASRVSLDLEFEFRSRLLSALLGQAFQRIVDSQVQAFVKRAAEIRDET